MERPAIPLGPEPSTVAAAGGARPPVILQVLPALEAGGVERGVVDLSAALTAAGWTSVVASAGGALVRDVLRAGATHVALPLGTRNPFAIRRNAGLLADVARAHSVDLVHARSRAPAWSALRAARTLKLPFVTTFHGTYGHGNPLKRLYNSVMVKGDRVIAISEFIARHVPAVYGADPGRIVTIPRGVDLAAFDPAAVTAHRIAKLARAWRLPDDAHLILLPGRLARWKGHMVLLDALPRLKRHDFFCVILGSSQGRGRYRAALERMVVERRLDARVRFIDHEPDMPAAYMLADVVVSASTSPEAFGRVAAEAQAMGRPVVATDHGGSRETVVPGETGWLVPPGRADALAAAVDRALALSGEERMVLAQRARAHIVRNFSLEAMCGATLAVYREVLANRARR